MGNENRNMEEIKRKIILSQMMERIAEKRLALEVNRKKKKTDAFTASVF